MISPAEASVAHAALVGLVLVVGVHSENVSSHILFVLENPTTNLTRHWVTVLTSDVNDFQFVISKTSATYFTRCWRKAMGILDMNAKEQLAWEVFSTMFTNTR